VTESSAQVYLSDALNIQSLFAPKSTTFVAKIQHSILLLKYHTKYHKNRLKKVKKSPENG
jgi:hypothetical protein